MSYASRLMERQHQGYRDEGMTCCPDCGGSLYSRVEVEALLQEQMHSLQDAYVRGATVSTLTPSWAKPDVDAEDYYDLGDAFDAEYEAQQADKAADYAEYMMDRMWD